MRGAPAAEAEAAAVVRPVEFPVVFPSMASMRLTVLSALARKSSGTNDCFSVMSSKASHNFQLPLRSAVSTPTSRLTTASSTRA